MRLRGKQERIATYGCRDKRWTLVSGPVGSGKTHSAIVGSLLTWSRYGDADFGVLTKGRPQLAATIKGGIELALGEELKVGRDGEYLLPSTTGMFNRLWPFVANDKRGEPRLRSFNFSGFLIDEMTTLPAGILEAADARCRVGSDPKLIGLTNPDGPRHRVKRRYFDRFEEIDGETIYTEMRDNPTISEAYIAAMKASFAGHMLERMVYGRWTAATGLIFAEIFDYSDEPPPDEPPLAYDVVIDVGESSVTHALLFGRYADGSTWVLAECRHDHRIEGLLPARSLVAKIRRAFAGVEIATWTVDPAAKNFRHELISQLPPQSIVGKAENDFVDGVEEVNYWLTRGALHLYGENLPHLMDEIGEYVWDEDASEKGDDKPVPTPDHGCDCLRYGVFTRTIHESGGREAWEAEKRRRREKT